MPSQESKGERLAYYDSLKSASANLAVSVDILKLAKGMGCPAFRGSRVYAEEWRKWLEENPAALTGNEGEGTDSLNALKKELLRQQIRRAREGADASALENAKRRGELIERKDLELAIPACLKEALRIQRQHLPTSLYNVVCEETEKGFARILTTAAEGDNEDEP